MALLLLCRFHCNLYPFHCNFHTKEFLYVNMTSGDESDTEKSGKTDRYLL